MHLADLDAGSGSLVIQALLAGVVGAAVAFQLSWRRMTGKLRRRPNPIQDARHGLG
jgi:hypothetical protein